jgi:hypothetical protein
MTKRNELNKLIGRIYFPAECKSTMDNIEVISRGGLIRSSVDPETSGV